MLGPRRSQSGFTLIETLASLLVFSLITLGMTPLLLTSIKGSALSRSYNISKNHVSRALERARGLPFFESVKGQASPVRRDIIDLFFPDRGAGFTASGVDANTFTTVCTATSKTPAPSADQACLINIPTGTTMTIRARFVVPQSTLSACIPPATGTCQNFNTAAPSANYNWNSVTTEQPPSQLLELRFTADWTYAGSPRTYSLVSYFSNRRLAPDNLAAGARVDYLVQAVTAYKESSGRTSRLEAVVGSTTSAIASRSVASAEQTVRAGRLLLTREEFGLASGQTLVDVSGANTALRGNAPAPTADVAGPAQNVSHPDLPTFGQIAYLDVSQVKGATTGTQVVNDLPKAIGEYAFTSGAGTNPTFWFQNQIQVGDPNQTDFLLNPLDHVLQMLRVGQVRAPASSTAEATAVSPASTRKVEATATAQFVGLNLFPTTYITAPGSGVPAVVKVDSFSANVQCKSTAGGATYPAVATGTWTAVLKYWADPANDGSFIAGVPVLGKTNGGYVTVGVSNNLPLAGSVGGAARDIMAEIGNPLVYDDADNARDVYLFKTPTTKGYLQSMSVNPNIKATADPSGRTTEVKIQNAIQLVTFQTDPTNEASAITLNIGNLSCEAADKRG